jgi:excisionase family DNA binding protein
MHEAIFLQGLTSEQFFDVMRAIIRHEMAQTQFATTAGQQPTVDELLTVQQAAKLLDVCVATIHEHKRRGMLKYRKIGSRVYFNRIDVLAAGTEHQRTAKPSRLKGQLPK